jgi:hypothetical protein
MRNPSSSFPYETLPTTSPCGSSWLLIARNLKETMDGWMDGWKDGRMEGWTIPNSVSDFAMHYRLPRPRRPPPRHVLRQARGPEGRGSRPDLEERSKRSECSKNDWRSKGRRRRRRSSVRSGKERSARRVWSLYYRAAAANRRARCTYTATHSKLSG